jgi:hypothetical protein
MIGGNIIQHVPRGESPEVPTAIERYLDWQRRYHASTISAPPGNTYFSERVALAQAAA